MGPSKPRRMGHPRIYACMFSAAQSAPAFAWQDVRGPAGAVVATLKRLGWEAPNWHQWLTRGKKAINILDLGKRSLTKIIHEDTFTSMGLRVGSKVWGSVGGLPLIKPLVSLVSEFRRAGAPGSTKARLLAGLVAGGFPTQHTLYLDRRVIDPLCQWCKTDVGTPSHRFYRCLGTHSIRMGMDVDDMICEANSQGSDPIFYSRCLTRSPEASWPPAIQRPGIKWLKFPQDGVFRRRICIDGSAIDPTLPFTRAGWAVVGMANDVCDIIGSCYGPLPHPIQEAGGGEIYAFLMALELCGAGPVSIVTDCKLVIDVWQQGPDQPLERLAFSELWRRIFDKGEDLGRENITLIKIKSHLSLTRALERGHPIWAWKGNKEADRLADLGARCHPRNPNSRTIMFP